MGNRQRYFSFFYGGIYKVVQRARLHRGAGAKPIRGESGRLVEYRYYLSDKGKDFIRTQEKSGIYGAGYFLDKKLLLYHEADQEWSTADVIRDPSSIAINSQLLPFDIYDLPSPDSDPDIHAYYEKFGTPPESR